jgi:hypothetical protein
MPFETSFAHCAPELQLLIVLQTSYMISVNKFVSTLSTIHTAKERFTLLFMLKLTSHSQINRPYQKDFWLLP